MLLYSFDLTIENTRTFIINNSLCLYDTFHTAGSGSLVVTEGVPRLKEIINISKNLKSENMTIYLINEYSSNKDNAKKIQSKFAYTQLKDILAKTEILSISYQVGRTGNITPVANLAPVYLAGTMIKRASIHNANEMNRLDLHEGDTVFVEKGGEIIPKITGVDMSIRNPEKPIFTFPTNCPDCNSELVRVEGEANHYCMNDSFCPTQIKGKIEHFIQRKALNIENIGVETIDLLFEKSIIKDVGDLYKLTSFDFLGLDGFQSKSIQNILSSIEKSKTVPFRKVLFGLGIRHVGSTIAEKLVIEFKSIKNLRDASYEELIAVPEIGDRIALSIISFFNQPNNIDLINRLEQSNVLLSEDILELAQESTSLEGKSFVISGVFQNFDRDGLRDKIILNGGKVVSSISSKLDYLIAGDNMGPSKLEKANQLAIKIITEEEFINLL
jgi:DNA ligase (NAD+)